MDIVEELRRDRENGAKRLVSEYKAGLMTLARRFLVNESDAEELVNATFAKVVANIDTYLEQSAFFAWMCQILTNEFRDSVRRKSRKMEVCPDALPDMADERAEDGIFRDLDHSLLRDAIETLPNEMKEAIMLHYIAEQPIPVVARFLRLPVSTVKWRLHVARQELARRLGAKVGDAVKKPGAKALLAVIALCALTAAGAAAVAVWNAATAGNAECDGAANATGGRSTPPALFEATPLSEGGHAAQDSSPLQEGAVAEGDWGSTAADTSASPTTGDTMNTTKTARTLAAASLAVATGIASAETLPTPSASLYVQNGLVACWDGIENAGTGLHDPSATVWTDLVAGREFTLTGVTVNDNRMTFAGAKTSYGSLSAADTEAVFLPATNGTVEVVYASMLSGNAVQTIIQSSTASGITMTFANQNLFYAGIASFPRYTISYGLATNTTAVHYSNAKPAAAFQNCVALATTSAANVGGSKATTTIGHTSSDNYNFKGHIFCIRVYNRHLTADELASNRELDLDRFVRGATDVTTTRKVKIANFDEDLATVYVNGEPAPNGAVFTIAKGDTFTVDIRDFQNDWYFAYAPHSQTDRTLAFDYWGGLPAGTVSNTATCTFTPREYLTTVVPNIDCKGYVWTAYDTTTISNATFRMSASAFNPATRSLRLGTCNAYYSGDKVMDLAMRVDYFGTNYTITTIGNSPVNNFGAVEMRVPAKLSSIGTLTQLGTSLTNIIGLADSAVTEVKNMALDSSSLLEGPAANYIPKGAVSIGHFAYRRGNLTPTRFYGPIVLPFVTSIGVDAFRGCSYATELSATAADLATISSGAFAGCTRLKKVTLASPALSSVSATAFEAVTNVTYLSSPPAQTALDNLIASVPASDTGKSLDMFVSLCAPGWWDLVSEPTAAEIAAGLPEGCLGVYATAGGERKGWIFAADDVDTSLVVTDMSQIGNAGYEIHADLAQGDTLTLSREGFTACDLQHFNRATGAWETFETKQGGSFTYTHDGRLTRARWKVSGFSFNVSSDCYGGTFSLSGATPIVGDNIYAPGAVLTVTASGRAEHPTSHFAGWTSGVSGEATNSATITLTMDADKALTASFYPDEWLYDASTKKITDGEYTSSAAVTLEAEAKSVATGIFTAARDSSLWLDLSLPVYVANDAENAYFITAATWREATAIQRIRLGPRFASFAVAAFMNSPVLTRLDGMGGSSLTSLPFQFLYCSSAPLHSQTYEANDFLPETLVSVSQFWYSGGPYLVGTLKLPNFTTVGTGDDNSFSSRTAGVTNLYLTCEALSRMPYQMFHGMKLQELTIGSTLLTNVVSGAFSGAAATLERMNFLAHAPAASALNNILASYNARTTSSANPLQIHCSKHAPGWRDLAAAVDRSSEEWRARPAGTWGIYQTAAGKRFYLVQRSSRYDKNLQTIIIMR